jgi:hypothetical protein
MACLAAASTPPKNSGASEVGAWRRNEWYDRGHRAFEEEVALKRCNSWFRAAVGPAVSKNAASWPAACRSPEQCVAASVRAVLERTQAAGFEFTSNCYHYFVLTNIRIYTYPIWGIGICACRPVHRFAESRRPVMHIHGAFVESP